jgi:hypothetical protein
MPAGHGIAILVATSNGSWRRTPLRTPTARTSSRSAGPGPGQWASIRSARSGCFSRRASPQRRGRRRRPPPTASWRRRALLLTSGHSSRVVSPGEGSPSRPVVPHALLLAFKIILDYIRKIDFLDAATSGDLVNDCISRSYSPLPNPIRGIGLLNPPSCPVRSDGSSASLAVVLTIGTGWAYSVLHARGRRLHASRVPYQRSGRSCRHRERKGGAGKRPALPRRQDHHRRRQTASSLPARKRASPTSRSRTGCSSCREGKVRDPPSAPAALRPHVPLPRLRQVPLPLIGLFTASRTGPGAARTGALCLLFRDLRDHAGRPRDAIWKAFRCRRILPGDPARAALHFS